MPKYSAVSQANVNECTPGLQKVFNFVIKHWDNIVTDGGRTLQEQQLNVLRGVSQTLNSRHLLCKKCGKSHAIDSMPYPTDWKAIEKGIAAIKKVDPGMQTVEAYMYVGFVQGVAAAFGVKLSSGVDWDGDRELSEHGFIDLPHHQVEPCK